jgi:hypothetical protein
MSGFPFRDIVLPAVLVSSATFAGLTLPFAFFTSEPVTVELPPFFSGQIQPIFATERKDMAIRYVGFAIVASVGAGMGTVEFIRTRQASQKLTQTQKQVSSLQLSLQGKEAQIETLKQAGDTAYADPILEAAEPPIETDEFPTLSLEQYLAAETPERELQPSGHTGTFDDAFFSSGAAIPAEWVDPASATAVQLPNYAVAPIASADSPLPVCREFVTCRVRVPHLQRSLFALLYEGEYYSLFRLRDDQEQALSIAAHLNQSGQKTVMTEADPGYAVWVHQPQAYPDLAA